jgi:glycosyltransferase involved in cell wall biosynthesis
MAEFNQNIKSNSQNIRILIDCTHTADQLQLNTGIQRVVRQLTSELMQITKVIPVKFNGVFISRVENLEYVESIIDFQPNNEIVELFSTQSIKKIANKIKRKLLTYLFYFPPLKLLRNKIKYTKFEQTQLSTNDVYLIADANWNLSSNYYDFLCHLKANDVQIVFICYDLIPIQFPQLCDQNLVNTFTNFYKKYTHLFDQVLCISHQVAADYQRIIGSKLPKTNPQQIVKSFVLGAEFLKDFEDFNKLCLINRYPLLYKNLSPKYILVVGSIVPHKNPNVIVKVFEDVAKTYQDLHLVFAGKKGWDTKTNEVIESNKLFNDRIHIFDQVNDNELNYLYQNCYCLVQASFYEGFGLPVIEALQHHKPVISSNAGSLPEVGRDFCLYFNPDNSQELYENLNKLLSSPDDYEQIINHLKANYIPPNWKNSAQQILSYLYFKSS